MISGLSVPLVGLIDAGVVGRLSAPEALGGVALGGWLFEMICWSFGFLRMGTTGLVAQAKGKSDPLELSATLARGLLTALGIGVCLSLCSPLLTGPALALLSGDSAEVNASAGAYLSARLWGMTPALLNYVCLGWLLGLARPRSALALQLLMNGLNASLSLWWGPMFGVGGVGGASAVAQWVTAGVGLSWVITQTAPRVEWEHISERLRRSDAWRALAQLNVDLFIRTALLLGVFGAMNSGSARLGALTLSANALLLHLQSAQAFALDGFAHGAEVLTGEAIGMSARARLRRVIKASAHLTALTALLISAVYAVAHKPIFMLLTTHDEVVSLAIEVAPWVIFSPLISAPCFLLDGVMIGATQASSMRRGMITSAVIFALIAMIGVPLLGNHGLWLAFLCFMATRALSLTPTLLRLYRG